MQVSPNDLEDVETFLVQWDEGYESEEVDSFDLDGGMVEALYFFLTASSDLEGSWFDDSQSLVRKVVVPEHEDVLLVDVFAGGTRLKSLHSEGLVANYLTVQQVEEAAERLSRIAQEDLGRRWEALKLISEAEKRQILGSLSPAQKSEAMNEAVAEFFVEEFVGYWLDAAQKGCGVVVLDCT